MIILISSCIRPTNPYASLAPGIWRGALDISGSSKPSLKDEIKRYEKDKTRPIYDPEDELPFLFEVQYDSLHKNKPFIEIINGDERIRLDDVRIGKNRKTAEDTIYIDFPIFDSYINGIFREGIIQGDWTVRNKIDYTIPFSAHYGKENRFNVDMIPSTLNLNGNWECNFDYDKTSAYKAVGEFKQNGNKLTGTFRTETGDYRYLDGITVGDKMYLSTFDGSHAYLFFAKQIGDTLFGTYKSGHKSVELWTGVKNNDFDLRPAASLTKSTSDKAIDFSFLDSNGKLKKLSEYGNKPKILQIMGTWCPNCYDESKYIKTYLQDHPGLGVEVIALACERYRDTVRALQAIANFKKNMDLPYDVLLASNTNKKEINTHKLTFIDTVMSYPTTLFLDKNNIIKQINTGIDGPATSKWELFKENFDKAVKVISK